MVTSQPSRRTVLSSIAGAGALSVAGCLGGDDDVDFPDPDREIRAVIPFSTGGGFDWYTRTVADYLPDHLPTDPTVVPENVTGGAGIVAGNEVWDEEPDGYTYMISQPVIKIHQQIVNPEELQFDFLDFTFLGQIDMIRYGLVRTPSVGEINDFDDLEEAMTTQPLGTTGIGSGEHLLYEMMGEITGRWTSDDIDLVHYDGASEAIAAMDRDEIGLFRPASGTAVPHFEDGTIEPVVLVSDEELPGWDGVELIIDWDVDGAEEIINADAGPRFWLGPPDMPDDVVEILDDAFMGVAEDSDFLAEAEENDRTVVPLDASETATMAEDMMNVWEEQEDLLRDVFEEE